MQVQGLVSPEAASAPEKFRLKDFFSRKAGWPVRFVRIAIALAAGLLAYDPLMDHALSGRALTAGETTMLRDTFGAAVNYSRIKINTTSFMSSRLDFVGSAAESFGNVVAVRYEDSRDDFSAGGREPAYGLFHEAGHIWQRQNCVNWPRFQSLKNGFMRTVLRQPADDIYYYRLEKGKDLTEYNSEQQANIITDYYLVKQKVQPVFLISDDIGKSFKKGDPRLAGTKPSDYADAMGNFLKDPGYAKNFCWKFF